MKLKLNDATWKENLKHAKILAALRDLLDKALSTMS